MSFSLTAFATIVKLDEFNLTSKSHYRYWVIHIQLL